MKIRLGTRGSALAMAQARASAERLRGSGYDPELVIIQTKGDQQRDLPFSQVGSAGVFVRELESALLASEVDLAVHSFKDLPSVSPENLAVVAMPERVDPADVLVSRDEEPGRWTLDSLPNEATVGTASARRVALLQSLRPTIQTAMLRGNVPTRLGRLRDGDFDAIVLAAAGLERLTKAESHDGDEERADGLLDGLFVHRLDPTSFVPAPTQGALAWQVRSDSPWFERLQTFDHPEHRPAITAERTALAILQGGCEVPFGAWAREVDGVLELRAFLADERGARHVLHRGDDPETLARAALDELRGAKP